MMTSHRSKLIFPLLLVWTIVSAGLLAQDPPQAPIDPPPAQEVRPPGVPSNARVVEEGWFAPPPRRLPPPQLPEQLERVYVIPVHGEINGTLLDSLRRKVVQAVNGNAQMVIFDMDTPGGRVDITEKIVSMIYQDLRDVYTVAYVNPRAISAGAIISMACNEIIYAPTGSMGDAMPVMPGPGGFVEIPEMERGKIESYMRGLVRSLAENRGYDTALAESMVTLRRVVWLIRHNETNQLRFVDAREWPGLPGAPPSDRAPEASPRPRPQRDEPEERRGWPPFGMTPQLAQATGPRQPDEPAPTTTDDEDDVPPPPRTDVPNWTYLRTVVGSDDLLTMTADEATFLGFTDHILSDLQAVQEHYGLEGEAVFLGDSWSERMVRIMSSSGLLAVLMLVAIMAGMIELQTPGFGVAGIIAIACLAVVFGSRYMTGLADWWEIALIVVGVVLLAIEIFVIPGFGFVGGAGVVMILVGIIASLVPHAPGQIPVPQTNLQWDLFREGLLAAILGIAGGALGAAILWRFVPRMPIASRIVLAAPDVNVATAPVADSSPLLQVRAGDEGVVVSPLHPVGRVRLAGDVLLDASAEGEVLPTGTQVRVVRRMGSQLIVERV